MKTDTQIKKFLLNQIFSENNLSEIFVQKYLNLAMTLGIPNLLDECLAYSIQENKKNLSTLFLSMGAYPEINNGILIKTAIKNKDVYLLEKLINHYPIDFSFYMKLPEAIVAEIDIEKKLKDNLSLFNIYNQESYQKLTKPLDSLFNKRLVASQEEQRKLNFIDNDLLIAVKSHDLITLSKLYNRGVNIHAVNDLCLYIASKSGDSHIAKFLLSRGASVAAAEEHFFADEQFSFFPNIKNLFNTYRDPDSKNTIQKIFFLEQKKMLLEENNDIQFNNLIYTHSKKIGMPNKETIKKQIIQAIHTNESYNLFQYIKKITKLSDNFSFIEFDELIKECVEYCKEKPLFIDLFMLFSEEKIFIQKYIKEKNPYALIMLTEGLNIDFTDYIDEVPLENKINPHSAPQLKGADKDLIEKVLKTFKFSKYTFNEFIFKNQKKMHRDTLINSFNLITHQEEKIKLKKMISTGLDNFKFQPIVNNDGKISTIKKNKITKKSKLAPPSPVNNSPFAILKNIKKTEEIQTPLIPKKNTAPTITINTLSGEQLTNKEIQTLWDKTLVKEFLVERQYKMRDIVSNFMKENHLNYELLNNNHIIIHRMPIQKINFQWEASAKIFVCGFLPELADILFKDTAKNTLNNIDSCVNSIKKTKARTLEKNYFYANPDNLEEQKLMKDTNKDFKKAIHQRNTWKAFKESTNRSNWKACK